LRITYYAWARNDENRLEQLFVVREHGRQVSQTWTGTVYASERAAQDDIRRLNCREGGR